MFSELNVSPLVAFPVLPEWIAAIPDSSCRCCAAFAAETAATFKVMSAAARRRYNIDMSYPLEKALRAVKRLRGSKAPTKENHRATDQSKRWDRLRVSQKDWLCRVAKCVTLFYMANSIDFRRDAGDGLFVDRQRHEPPRFIGGVF
jgi:hypothetical protein